MTNSSPLKGGTGSVSRPAARDVWQALSRGSFAVLSHVTADGAPRSSGVLYAISGDRMLVAVAKDSWKARQIGTGGPVSVTVPIRRGGLLSLLLPIPPATVSFPAVATGHTGEALHEVPALAKLVPAERRTSCVVRELRPTGHYLTYGLGVPLLSMRDPVRSRARIPVG